MSAGPFPTKVMHEALKTRITTLETGSGTPGAGAASAARLSDEVRLDTSTGRTLSGGEIGGGISVRSGTITIGPNAEPFQIDMVRAPFFSPSFPFTMLIYESEAAKQADTTTRAEVVGYGNVYFEPVTLGPGWIIMLLYQQRITNAFLNTVRADPALGIDATYTSDTEDAGGSPITAFNFAILAQFLDSRNVFTPLAADGMRVVQTPSALEGGEFEIVAPLGTAPALRFMRDDGEIFTLVMTPEA